MEMLLELFISKHIKISKRKIYEHRYKTNKKEKIKEYNKKYRLKNKEKINETRRKNRIDNKENIKEKERKYRIINKEKLNEKQRINYQKNREKELKRHRIYNLKNKEKKSEKYRKNIETFEGYKKHMKSKWKNRGLNMENFEEIFLRYINTTNCDNCNVVLTKDRFNTSTTRCMDHCHKTGNFRNILCIDCNNKRR